MRSRALRRLAAVLGLAVLLGLASGCFVLDELDKGKQEMGRYDKDKKPGASPGAPAATAQKADGPSVKEITANWWKQARSIGGEVSDASIVHCEIKGRVEFTREVDCLSRGGHPQGR